MEELPTFRYHPAPIATGSIERSDVACTVCARSRGYIYTGHVWTAGDDDFNVCPWCIADGSAHARFGATFAEEDYVGGGKWCAVPPETVQLVATRTPSFMPWQTVYWVACCGDAAAFLGRAGHAEIVASFADVEPALRAEMDMVDAEHDEAWQEYFTALDKEDSPTAYVFRCLHCGKLGGFSDCH